MTSFDLTSARATATIDLVGGRLASLIVDDMELLVTEAAKPTRWGSFPMVPWCGRLDHGLLVWDGEQYQFPLTSGAHANHGTAMHQTWTQLADGEIESDLGEHWPFGGRVSQHFAVTDAAFTVHMTVTAEEVAMPAQLGWHPWYRRQHDSGAALEVKFAAGRIYATDDHQIPTGELLPVPDGPWDETFIDVTQTPILRWGDALTLSLSSNFDHWVVFTQPDHAVAIEPQSGAPNDLNRAPHILEPGESLTGWMTLAWD
jgi:aldose 1-epimerase